MSHLCRYSLLLSLILISLAGFSQTSKIDSLKKVLVSLPPEGRSFASDTVRVMVLCELGKMEEPISANHFIEQSNQISKKINWQKGKMHSEYLQGMNYGKIGSYYRGSQNFYRALKLAEDFGDKEMIYNILYELGNFYDLMGDAKKSLSLHLNSSKYVDKNSIKKANLLNIIGTDYYSIKNLKMAEKYFTLCLAECKKNNHRKVQQYALSNLTTINIEKRYFLEAEKYLKEYEYLLSETGSSKINLYACYAKLYLARGQTDVAEKAAKQMYSLAIQAKDYYYDRMKAHELMYQIYNRQNNPNRALEHFKKWIELRDKSSEEMKDKQIEALKFEYENDKQKIQIMNLDNELTKKQYERDMLIVGIVAFCLIIGILFRNNKILQNKNSQIEKQRSELTKLKDEIAVSNQQLLKFNEELENKVAIRTKELVEANEKLIVKNHEIQQAFITGKTQERKRVASELHDNLGSTISGLIWQLQGIMPENLSSNEQLIYEGLIQQMQDAYTEVRHISHHLVPHELEKGLNNALQKLVNDLNTNGRIVFYLEINYPEKLITKNQEVELYSICLEIINNTLKHSNANECIIKIHKKDAQLEVTVKDNGQGFDLKNLGNRGRGFFNIEERVKLLSGTLSINSQLGEGSCFIISIPLNA